MLLIIIYDSFEIKNKVKKEKLTNQLRTHFDKKYYYSQRKCLNVCLYSRSALLVSQKLKDTNFGSGEVPPVHSGNLIRKELVINYYNFSLLGLSLYFFRLTLKRYSKNENRIVGSRGWLKSQ